MFTNIYAILPAHNEETNIKSSLLDLINQTFELQEIIIVNDQSTDRTGEIIRQLQSRYSNIVMLETTKPELRAGAINEGLRYLQKKEVDPPDFVLIADADSRFQKDLVQQGVRSLEKNSKIGGVCSTAGVLNPTFNEGDKFISSCIKWVLWRLQRLEYSNFDATRTATWNNVLILHGLCSMFRFEAITQVGGYQPNHLLEDYKLTTKLKKGGWTAIFNPRMIAATRVPENIKALVRQRLRWMTGGIKIIIEEGINKYTIEDFFNHSLFITLLIVILITTFMRGFEFGIHLSTNLLPIALVVTGYLVSIYNLKYVRNKDLIDIVMRILIVPELLMSMFYSGLQVVAYSMMIFNVKQKW